MQAPGQASRGGQIPALAMYSLQILTVPAPYCRAPSATVRIVRAALGTRAFLTEKQLEIAAGEFQTRVNMRRYAAVRALVLVGLAVIAVSTCEVLEIHIPLLPLLWVIVALSLLNGVYYLRLGKPWPVTHREIFANALIDVAGLTTLLYFTGGALNPLANCYLLLVLYATMVLPRHLSWSLAAICVVCYSALQLLYVPLPLTDPEAAHADLDEWARWVMYVLLAGVLAWFGIRLNDLRRAHIRHLENAAEEGARERYLVGLATLAAGTAHEMGTPLSTMSLVVDDMRRSTKPPPDWKQSVDVLWQQIQICRTSLLDLAYASDLDQLGKVRAEPALEFVQGTVARFRQMRPGVPVTLHYEGNGDAAIRVDQTLRQALLSLISNASDASPDAVELRVSADDGVLTIRIMDRGPGIPPWLRERLGKGPVGPRDGGHGLGLMIANSAIGRLGGIVLLLDREGGGTCVQVELPLAAEDAIERESFWEAPVASG